MSRARLRDNSNPVQLFPFVAVLLCTMGSLLVILVVVARCSWDQGLQQAAAKIRAEADAPKPNDEIRQKLQAVNSYVEQLGTVRTQAEQKLQSDQMQLSHLEDHMRRLQNHLDSLRVAAGELNGLEREHYDDRAQAEREVARLGQLVTDTKQEIDELKQKGNHKPRSYAIVPFVGRNGTRRPPIYVECRDKELILQPEGIHLTGDDLAPELGPASPLAAALRAAREYLVSQNAAAAEPEPYPLLLVRPKGEYAFYETRAVFERCGIQFGYELVDGNWDLKYPPANPELAACESQAIELARGRAQALAEAAPGMLRRGRDDDEASDPDDDFAGSGLPGGVGGSGLAADGLAGNGLAVDDADLAEDAEFGGAPASQGYGLATLDDRGHPRPSAASAETMTTAPTGSTGAGGNQASNLGTDGPHGTGLPNLLDDARGGDSGGVPPASHGPLLASGAPAPIAGSNGGSAADIGAPASAALPGDPAPRSPGAAIVGPADGSSTAAAAVTVGRIGPRSRVTPEADDDDARPLAPTGPGMYRDPPPEQLARKPADEKPVEKRHPRGKNWALVDANSQSTPIRRTIQVVVRDDRVAILPEGASAAEAISGGREIPLTGNSRESYEPFLMALETQIKDWGMAGRGLYWRPVLDINAGPDGQRRAADIARLLKTSGIELRNPSAVATQNQGTNSGASSPR